MKMRIGFRTRRGPFRSPRFGLKADRWNRPTSGRTFFLNVRPLPGGREAAGNDRFWVFGTDTVDWCLSTSRRSAVTRGLPDRSGGGG